MQRLSIRGASWETGMTCPSSGTPVVLSHWPGAVQVKCHTGSEGEAARALMNMLLTMSSLEGGGVYLNTTPSMAAILYMRREGQILTLPGGLSFICSSSTL